MTYSSDKGAKAGIEELANSGIILNGSKTKIYDRLEGLKYLSRDEQILVGYKREAVEKGSNTSSYAQKSHSGKFWKAAALALAIGGCSSVDKDKSGKESKDEVPQNIGTKVNDNQDKKNNQDEKLDPVYATQLDAKVHEYIKLTGEYQKELHKERNWVDQGKINDLEKKMSKLDGEMSMLAEIGGLVGEFEGKAGHFVLDQYRLRIEKVMASELSDAVKKLLINAYQISAEEEAVKVRKEDEIRKKVHKKYPIKSDEEESGGKSGEMQIESGDEK